MDHDPIIGISMRVGDNPDHASVDIRYLHRIEEAGGIPIALPYGFEAAKHADSIVDLIDGLLLTGGGDPCPECFGRHPYAENCMAELSFLSAERDAFEYAAAHAAWDRGLPTLGVCRGLQVMNVAFGGTLVRDISELDGKHIEHVVLDRQDEAVHTVSIKGDSKLAAILGTTELGVNSLHHLAICKSAKGGEIVARASDGTPEALEFPEKDFFLGVQWHPEIIANTPQLFTAFVDACRMKWAGKRTARRPFAKRAVFS